MIYNWTNFPEGSLGFSDVSASELSKYGIAPIANVKYLLISSTDSHLVDDRKHHVYPSKEDVFIRGDDAYGLDAIVSSRKVGHGWEFSLLVHVLKKEKFSAPKSFALPRG